MRYRLRTLLIASAIGPPVLAGAWFIWRTQWTYEGLLIATVIIFAATWIATIAMLQS